MEIIVRKYEHINRSLGDWDTPKGKYISSRAHYEREMKKQGFVPYEKAETTKSALEHKDYDGISDKAMRLCLAARDQADKKGNIKAGSKLIDGMKEVGVCFNYYDKLPKTYEDKGGFTE